jgi:hypothetical protein
MFDSRDNDERAYLLSVLAGMRSTLASEKLRGVLCEISGTESAVEKLLRVFEPTALLLSGVRRVPAEVTSSIGVSERPASGMKASSSIFIEKKSICHAVSETIKY